MKTSFEQTLHHKQKLPYVSKNTYKPTIAYSQMSPQEQEVIKNKIKAKFNRKFSYIDHAS